MTIILNSRVERIYAGRSYRDIAIHELTECEIDWLKTSRWMAAAVCFAGGMLGGAVFMLWTFYHAGRC